MKSNNMGTKTLGMVASLASAANAFFRMPCGGRLVLERADPIVSPGAVAGHVHTISGGNGFGFSMDYDQARASSCSSCPIKADLSNYWTPKLYYMAENGTYEDVPQAGEYNGNTGGMTVYYQQRPGPKNDELKAFPENFRMLAGDPFQRNYTGVQAAPGNAVSFVCLDYSGKSPQSNEIPNTNCPDGLRAQVYFPSCWDGVNTDSHDHKSHMAYPIGHYDNGYCPDSHPVHLVSIFFEVIYSIDQFADRWHGSGHPFVFAQGDRTGYGFHGDFVNGWDIPTLQRAVDTCNDDSGLISDCGEFNKDGDLFTSDDQQACRIPPSVDEAVTGVLEALPGCNPSTDGPEYAPPPATCAIKAAIGQPASYFTDVTTSLGWAYVGCASDKISSRTFTGASKSGADMTVATCIDYCKGKGFSLAGLEYSDECYCDKDYSDDSRKPKTGVMGNCGMPCAGDSSEFCGGAAAMSVYSTCNGGSCTNALLGVVGNTTSSEKAKRHLGKHRHARVHHDS